MNFIVNTRFILRKYWYIAKNDVIKVNEQGSFAVMKYFLEIKLGGVKPPSKEAINEAKNKPALIVIREPMAFRFR